MHSCFEVVFTGRKEVLAKVIFLHLSVILFTGGVVWQGDPPPPAGWRDPPMENPPGWRTNPPPGSGLRHTVYDRPVRILLECILVLLLKV